MVSKNDLVLPFYFTGRLCGSGRRASKQNIGQNPGAFGSKYVRASNRYRKWRLSGLEQKINKIAFDRLGADGYFKLWVMNPDGSQMMGLVITDRPDTRKRGSGIIVLIDPVY